MPKKISERSRNHGRDHGRTHKDCYLQALIHRQTHELPKIIYELQTFRSKKTHWAWWVFPTNHCGTSEPPPATKVSSPAAAKALLASPPVKTWRRALEMICDLSEERGRLVMPAADHGRVLYFVAFWERLVIPTWLKKVLTRIESLFPAHQLARPRKIFMSKWKPKKSKKSKNRRASRKPKKQMV